MGLAQLHEPGRLVSSGGINCTTEVMRVVCNNTNRATVHPGQRSDHAISPLRTKLQNGVDIEEPIDDIAHVIDLLAVLGDHMAKCILVRNLPVIERSLEVAQVLLGDSHTFGLIGNPNVDNAVALLYFDRTDFGRVIGAQSAAFDHRGTSHTDVRVLGCDDHVAASQDGGITSEAIPGVDADHGYES